MKYCLSSRQTNEYLKRADEIKVKYRDRDIIYDYSQKYPTAHIILELPLNNEGVDWTEINNYARVCNGGLILCLANLKDIPQCKELDVKYYYGFPVGSFYELQSLKALGVCYFKLAAPAFFQLDLVKGLGVPVRAVPNVCYDAYFPHENGIHGQWTRPEDVDTYDEYIEVFEFENADLEKERALYRIYHDDRTWPGDLNMLFTNFNYSAINRLLPPTDTMVNRRVVCGQRCQQGKPCGLCEMYFAFGNPAVGKEIDELLQT